MDFLGIILFIAFMIISAGRDRKKGMTKTRPARPEPVQSQPDRPEPVRPEPIQLKRKIAPVQDKRAERRSYEPAKPVPDRNPPYEPISPYLEEGMSAYDESPMKGPSQGELSPIYALGDFSRGPGIQELRHAIIWSEILQKPRALRKRIR